MAKWTVCEWNHCVTDRCLEKILEDDPEMPLNIALPRAINAKNSLQMWNGFSSYQLAFGQNPNIHNVMTDKPPALHSTTIGQVVSKHLNALHTARQAFVKAESSERIRRALRYKIRANSEKYESGDKVFYKREKSNEWKGSGFVIGQDGRTLFVRHGSTYVRVSANRIMKLNDEVKIPKIKRLREERSTVS